MKLPPFGMPPLPIPPPAAVDTRKYGALEDAVDAMDVTDPVLRWSAPVSRGERLAMRQAVVRRGYMNDAQYKTWFHGDHLFIARYV